MPVPSYPGKIDRQELVDFCKEQRRRVDRDLDTLQDAHDIATKAGDTQRATQFSETIAMRIGEANQLRNVCEWARERVENADD